MKVNQENTKLVELKRSRVNSDEVARTFYDGKMESGFEKPTNYEEWSKSLELARTLTPISTVAC